VGARFSAPVQTGPGVHPASCTMGNGSFPGVKSGRSVTLTPHPLLVPCSRKGRAIPLLPLWAVRPVQSLSTCTRVHFSFFFNIWCIPVARLARIGSGRPINPGSIPIRGKRYCIVYTERSGSAAYQPLVQRATSGVELTTGCTGLDDLWQRATQQRV
jgi:hypothetical protein